jgi:2,3,4,5-tetrahydropyridine-2,6-dicarboxylate N-succinyltransferase
MEDLKNKIIAAYANRELLKDTNYEKAIHDVLEALDKGLLRVAEPTANGWQVNEWVKQAILMYFGVMPMQIMQEGPEQYYDKIPLKKGMKELGIRTVPGSIIRHGAFVAPSVICMPSFINIGAFVDAGTMVDTWATVGSCAQIGKHVHLSGGVGIGGVLEPLQASPVIIEDNCFIGSRCIVVEGVHVEKEAVLGANVVLTQSTKIIDVSGAEPITYVGRVPSRSVVIPGSYAKQFNAGSYHVNCALIIGQRKESTDTKTSLNDALRDFGVSV